MHVSSVLLKGSILDPQERIEKLIASWELTLRQEFLLMVRQIKNKLALEEVERLLTLGQIEQAFKTVDDYVAKFAAKVNQSFIAGGEGTAGFLSENVGVVLAFDQVNFRAVDIMRANQLRLIREFGQDARESTRIALTDGIARGLNPREQARNFREAIGLTGKQEQAVRNYKRMLEQGNREALSRQLRDKRFDRTVDRAIRNGEPLTQEQIDRMVSRYRERYLKYRSETIGRTESIPAVHRGTTEMYQQAIDAGKLNKSQLEREWHVKRDEKLRDSHSYMQGQKRLFGEPFQTGAGHLLMFPGDTSLAAPAEERLSCRCGVSTRIKEAAA
jgi:hypothetical protein